MKNINLLSLNAGLSTMGINVGLSWGNNSGSSNSSDNGENIKLKSAIEELVGENEVLKVKNNKLVDELEVVTGVLNKTKADLDRVNAINNSRFADVTGIMDNSCIPLALKLKTVMDILEERNREVDVLKSEISTLKSNKVEPMSFDELLPVNAPTNGAEVVVLKNTICKKDDTIAELEEEVESKAAEINKLKEVNKSSMELVGMLKDFISNKDLEVANLTKIVSSQQETIGSLSSIITEQQKVISRLSITPVTTVENKDEIETVTTPDTVSPKKSEWIPSADESIGDILKDFNKGNAKKPVEVDERLADISGFLDPQLSEDDLKGFVLPGIDEPVRKPVLAKNVLLENRRKKAEANVVVTSDDVDYDSDDSDDDGIVLIED